MKINAYEIINFVVMLCSMFLIKRQRDVTTLLLILFFYGTLHFSFAIIALVVEDNISMDSLHVIGGGLLVKLSALLLLVIIFVLLSRQAFDLWRNKLWRRTKVEIQILMVMLTVVCGYVFNVRYGDWLQLKNVVSIEIMLAFLLIGYITLSSIRTYKVKQTYLWCMAGLVILFGADCVGFYEVFFQQSWASTPNDSGEHIYRASSILFNPNLFAYWASLVYLCSAYGMYVNKNHQRMMIWGMVLASIAIYLSGSRSAGLPLLGVLFIFPWLMKERLRWLPLMIFLLNMLAIYALAKSLELFLISNSEGWHDIALLGERFFFAPLSLIGYILNATGIRSRIGGLDVSNRTMQSIEGRFIGDSIDSGWVVLYQDAGWFGLISVILAACLLVAWGVRVHIARPSVSSVYALATLFYCLSIGFGIRFQIFPVWLFISIVLIPCLAFWRQATLPTLNIRS